MKCSASRKRKNCVVRGSFATNGAFVTSSWRVTMTSLRNFGRPATSSSPGVMTRSLAPQPSEPMRTLPAVPRRTTGVQLRANTTVPCAPWCPVACRAATSRYGRQNRSLQQASDERRARLGTHAHLLPWSSLLPAWAALPWSALLPPFPLLPALPLLPWSSLLPVWALLPWSSLLPAWAWLPWLSLLPALAWLPWSSLLAWPSLGAQTRPGAIRASSSSISSVNSMVLSCTFQYGPQNGCQPRSQSLPANGHLLSGLGFGEAAMSPASTRAVAGAAPTGYGARRVIRAGWISHRRASPSDPRFLGMPSRVALIGGGVVHVVERGHECQLLSSEFPLEDTDVAP